MTQEKFENVRSHYTQEYLTIRGKAEKTWPQWKIDHYNNSIATSTHAKKLQNKIKE